MGFCAPWWITHTVRRRQPIWIFTPDQIKPFQLSVNISTTLQSIFRIENHRGRARPSSRRRRRGWRRISSWSSARSASPWSPSSLLSSSWFSSSPVSCKHTWSVIILKGVKDKRKAWVAKKRRTYIFPVARVWHAHTSPKPPLPAGFTYYHIIIS